MNPRFFLLLLSLFVAFFGATSALAGANEAKAHMRERVPVLDQLKQSEAIGENNQGFVEVRKAGGDAAAVVAAENKDRQELFADTAAKTGSSAAAVGKAFARQIAAASAPGVWIQHDDGSWHKK